LKSIVDYFYGMSEKRFYPIFLAAISETPIKIKLIRDQFDYDAFYARFRDKVGTLIIEVKTLESVYLERRSKFDPEINEHSFLWPRDPE
jgi:hypothetical protein